MARSRQTCWMTPASSRRGRRALLRRHRSARRRPRRARARRQERLRAAAPAGRRPLGRPRPAMHLTLKFLGAGRRRAGAAVRDGARGRRVRRRRRSRLSAPGSGVFPGPAPAAGRVGGDRGRPARARGCWRRGVEHALEPLGFPPEARPFRGHVDARPGALAARARTARAGARGRSRRSDVRALDRLRGRALSQPSAPTGSVYEPLARLPLAGGVG